FLSKSGGDPGGSGGSNAREDRERGSEPTRSIRDVLLEGWQGRLTVRSQRASILARREKFIPRRLLNSLASVLGQKFFALWTASVRVQKRSIEARMSSALLVHTNGAGEWL